MDTLTETDLSVQLDARTMEELQPPCDWRWQRNGRLIPGCSKPAEWALTVLMSKCGHLHHPLTCDKHLQFRLHDLPNNAYCNGCPLGHQNRHILSVEPI